MENRWLLLLHQIPAKPDYLRVKIGRRLARLGAVAVKNGAYTLPSSEPALEDLQWVLREVIEGGGEGAIFSARAVGGLDDARIEQLFRDARDAELGPLVGEAREMLAGAAAQGDEKGAAATDLARLRRRLSEVTPIDFFESPRRLELEGLVAELARRIEPRQDVGSADESPIFRGRTWVTRRGIKVDRIASAWLIRRFIDPDAHFRFVEGKDYDPAPGELRFDMFEAEFTHDGDACTFEVLVRRFLAADTALTPLAEIVHDIDLKDQKFGRPEVAGVAAMIDAIVAGHPSDEARLTRAGALLDDLYGLFGGRR